jgi:thiamine-phosphate pyrophosphorylase
LIPRLYAILDVDVATREGWTPLDLSKAFFAGGARLVQLRAKRLPSGALLDLAAACVGIAAEYGARIIINDRADVARLAGAAGVHLGQADLLPRDARLVLAPSAAVGVSTHEPGQVTAALDEPIDYIAFGPVFDTRTKAAPEPTVGLDGVREAVRLARPRGMPVVAIGGITLDRVREVIDAGADSVAVITDLLATKDPAERVREYLSGLSARP